MNKKSFCFALLAWSCSAAGTAWAQSVPPRITQWPADQTVFAGETAVFSVTAGGTPPLRYQWNRERTAIPDATNATLVLTNASFGDAADEFWVEVRNDFGVDYCWGTRLTVLPEAPIPGFLDGTFRAPAGFGSALLVQSDGRLLAGGSGGVVRLWPDGSVDSSFSNSAVSGVTMMAQQSDGRVIVLVGNRSLPHCQGHLRRLNADGTLDSSFAIDYARGLPFIVGVCVSAVALQPDDKILFVYRLLYAGSEDDYWLDPIVRRLNPDGSEDASFAWYVSSCDDVQGLAVMPDGGVLVGTRDLVRLHPDGQRDQGFIRSELEPGRTACLSLALVYCFGFQPDGKILIGGAFTNAQGQARSRLARLHPNGALDLSFNPPAIDGSEDNSVRTLALQPDGKILVGGGFETMDGVPREGLARLQPEGSLDAAFVTGAGLMDDETSGVLAILVQSPDKAIVGGKLLEYWGVPVGGGLMRIFLEEAPADGDADGMPDTWETHYFGSLATPTGDAAADPDSDRMSNREEYLAGTNPLQASSVLKIFSVERSGTEMTLRFSTVAGRRYQIEQAENLSAPIWNNVGPSLVATGAILSASVPFEPVAGTRYFRVRVP